MNMSQINCHHRVQYFETGKQKQAFIAEITIDWQIEHTRSE